MTAAISGREHARLARELIAACGGLDEACHISRIRSKSTLSDYQNPHLTPTMPADVIADLELYCGKPIYSSALFERCERGTAAGNLRDLSCGLTETAADLQRVVGHAIADDTITPREHDAIDAAIDSAREALERLEGAKRAAETQRPALKAVR